MNLIKSSTHCLCLFAFLLARCEARKVFIWINYLKITTPAELIQTSFRSCFRFTSEVQDNLLDLLNSKFEKQTHQPLLAGGQENFQVPEQKKSVQSNCLFSSTGLSLIDAGRTSF